MIDWLQLFLPPPLLPARRVKRFEWYFRTRPNVAYISSFAKFYFIFIDLKHLFIWKFIAAKISLLKSIQCRKKTSQHYNIGLDYMYSYFFLYNSLYYALSLYRWDDFWAQAMFFLARISVRLFENLWTHHKWWYFFLIKKGNWS